MKRTQKAQERTDKAVIYCRVSTGQQVEEGVSLDAQLSRARAWCQSKGYEVIGEYQDAGLSGCRADNRPGLQGALKLACDNKAAFVAYSLDRFTRSTVDAITIATRLRDAGADLVSLSENLDTMSPTGEFIYTLFAALARLERRQVSQRTKVALTYKREQGFKTGGDVPYGYTVDPDGRLAENPNEQRAIQYMRNLRNRGNSLRAIAHKLTERKISNRNGGNWHPQVINTILNRVDG